LPQVEVLEGDNQYNAEQHGMQVRGNAAVLGFYPRFTRAHQLM